MPNRCLLAVVLVLLAAAPAARADGDSEARVSGRCSAGASSELRIRARDGAIAVEFTLRRHRSGEAWRVVLVHERRVRWRGTLRTRGSSGSLRLRRSVPDFDGPDQVSVRATGPRGLTCFASATLTG